MTTLPQLRRTYHNEIALQIVRFSGKSGESYPNFADGSSRSSVVIANGIAELLGFPIRSEPRLSGQTAGSLFEKLTCDFLQSAFCGYPSPASRTMGIPDNANADFGIRAISTSGNP